MQFSDSNQQQTIHSITAACARSFPIDILWYTNMHFSSWKLYRCDIRRYTAMWKCLSSLCRHCGIKHILSTHVHLSVQNTPPITTRSHLPCYLDDVEVEYITCFCITICNNMNITGRKDNKLQYSKNTMKWQ